MSNEVATTAPNAAPFQPNQQAIAQYLGLNPNDAKSHAVVAVCERYELDPVLKHVIVIPKGGVYITRDGLLHIAHRSGQLDGIVVEQFPKLEDGEWTCIVSVYRKDMRHPFTFPGRYPANGGNRQYAQEMAMKAAESHALRRAFDVNGIPSIDETRGDEPTSGRRTATRNAPAPTADEFTALAEEFQAPTDDERVDTTTGEIVEEDS